MFLIVFLLLTFPSEANENNANRLQSSYAKRLTIEALKDIKSNNWEKARKKIEQSSDPLASKMYNWLILVEARNVPMTNERFALLLRFIRQNPEWPDNDKMKLHAEKIMPKSFSNAKIIKWYDDFPPKTSYGMERYIEALMARGDRKRAKDFLTSWWASALTPRDQQRDIFKKYGNLLTIEAHKKRLDALLYDRRYKSALAIADVLGQGYPELARARIALAKNRNSGLGKLIDKVPPHLRDDPGLLYERLRWRRERNLDEGALEILEKMPDKSVIQNPKSWWKERHIMIRRLLEKKEYEKAFDLARNHIQEDGFSYAQAQWMAGWLALRFVDKPAQALMRFSAMYEKVTTPVSRARAAYWAGRAAYDLGQYDLSKDWYKKAAMFQTVFYGQLAGAAISRKGKLPKAKLPTLFRSDRRNYQKNELIQAMELFKNAGMNDYSDRFLHAFLEQEQSPKAYLFAAETAAKDGDSYNAVKISKKATREGLFLTKQSYPTITKHLHDIDSIEWALIHALIRQESMFDIDAKSHAGARGLMQIMPRTAHYMSKKLGLTYNRSWLTSRPKYNIIIGSEYMSSLIERYDGNYPLAIAAYNAGPSRVNSWLSIYGDPRDGEIDLVDWIELIPLYETRNYVQRIMENIYIYRLRLDNIQEHPEKQLHIAIHAK